MDCQHQMYDEHSWTHSTWIEHKFGQKKEHRLSHAIYTQKSLNLVMAKYWLSNACTRHYMDCQHQVYDEHSSSQEALDTQHLD